MATEVESRGTDRQSPMHFFGNGCSVEYTFDSEGSDKSANADLALLEATASC